MVLGFPGRIPYQDLAELRDLMLAAGEVVQSGDVLTTNTEGYAIKVEPNDPPTTPITIDNGLFIAVESATGGATDGAVRIQVAVTRSRVSMLLAAGVRPGMKVATHDGRTCVPLNMDSANPGHLIGTVYEFDEPNANGLVSSAGWIGIVEVGL